MNIKKFSKNKINIKLNNVNRGSPNQKENYKLENSKYFSLLKITKKNKSPLKEKSKNSIVYNSPRTGISEDKIFNIKKIKKF